MQSFRSLGLLLLLAAATAAAAESFEPPVRMAENREGGVAPFSLYAPIAFAGVPGMDSGLALWIERRFASRSSGLDLLGKRLDGAGVGPDQHLGRLEDLIPAEGAALAVESGARVHLFYATRLHGESRLVHRRTDISLAPGAEEVLDRDPRWLGAPAAVIGPAGLPLVVYRRGSDLVAFEVPSSRPEPILLAAAARPTSFAVAAAGGSCFVAFSSSRRERLPEQLLGRIELLEIRDGALVSRSVLAEPPVPVSGIALAASPQGRLALAWSDDRLSVPQLVNTEIHGRIREPGGAWLPEQRFSYTLAESFAPALAWDASERLHIVWQDNALGAYEIFHRTAGQEAGVDVVSPRDGADSVTPQAAILGGRLAVVWRDARDGRADLYLSRQSAAEARP